MGLKAGVNMNSLSSDISDYEQAAKMGFVGGLFFRIGDKVHVQPEGYFSLRRGEIKAGLSKLDPADPSKSVDVTQEMTLSTLDVPILIGYKILDPPAMNIRLQAGPVVSMVLNKKFDLTFDNGIESEEIHAQAIEEGYKDANWGFQAGAGVDFLFLTVDVRYELGLTKIYDHTDAAYDLGNLKNNAFFVSVGWKFM